MGTKARPYYRMVVANSTEPRGGKFVEILGTYNPVAKPVHMSIKEDRALHWLIQGAQPSETAAVVLSKVGVLERYFEQRPKAKKAYKFLDKRTASMSVKSVMEAPASAPAPKPEPAPEPVEAVAPAEAEAPTPEPVAEETPPVEAADAHVEEAPAPVEEPEPAAISAEYVPAGAEAAEEKPE